MSKLTIKSHSVKEDNESVSWTNAYRDLVSRCWRDTPDGNKPNYSEKAINFILDCAHIANGTNVKGLPQQGFTLKTAHVSDLIGDCLHLQYSKDGGRKGVDVWLNPHTQKALVDLYGFNPKRPYDSTHKEFDARNNDADEFAEFIESLPKYKGESIMKKCSMSKKIESLRKMSIRVHERVSKDRKITVVHFGIPVDVGVDDLLQGLSRINSLNGNYWCFKVLGFDPEYISEVAPNHHWDSKKIIAGIGKWRLFCGPA